MEDHINPALTPTNCQPPLIDNFAYTLHLHKQPTDSHSAEVF